MKVKELTMQSTGETYTLLQNRSVIALKGKDAVTFLNRLTTNDISKSNNTSLVYTWLLTPNGRWLYDFFILRRGENELLLDCSAAKKDTILSHLSFYKLQSDLSIDDLSNKMSVIASLKESKDDRFTPDPRDEHMGYRTMVARELMDKMSNDGLSWDIEPYHMQRIQCCLPDNDLDIIPNRSFPLEYGMNEIGAIDYKKGCYVGQEAIASVHYKGAVRKCLQPISWDRTIADSSNSVKLVNYQDEIMDGETKVGIVLGVVGNTALSLINLDKITQNRLHVNGTSIMITPNRRAGSK